MNPPNSPLSSPATSLNPAAREYISLAAADKGRPHIFGYDLIRAFAIILVLVCHVTFENMLLGTKAGDTFTALIGFVIGLFFMLTGALLLPLSSRTVPFLKRRFLRVLLPFVVWSCLYAVANYFTGRSNDFWIRHQIEWCILSPTFTAGWFVPVILGYYLAIPLVSPWIRQARRRWFVYIFIFWIASGFLPWMQIVSRISMRVNPVWPFVGFMGYLFAGYYLARFPLKMVFCDSAVNGVNLDFIPRRWRSLSEKATTFWMRYRTPIFIAGTVVAGILFPWYMGLHPGNQNLFKLLGNEDAFHLIILSVGVFALMSTVRTIGRFGDVVVRFIARHSFGMYLNHQFLLRFLLKDHFPQLLNTWWSAPTILILSFLLAWLCDSIPYLRKLLG